MTLSEAIRQGFRRVRLPTWDARAYLKLLTIPSGPEYYSGPWAKLYDPVGQAQRGQTTPMTVRLPETTKDDRWETYRGEGEGTDGPDAKAD